VFDEAGPGAHLADRTREDLRVHYACFLGFLRQQHPHRLQQPAAERVSSAIVAELVACRRRTCRETTIASDLHKLRHVLTMLCPDSDWSWLLAITRRIAAKARPLPDRNNLVTSDRLYALGINLMDRAATDARGMPNPTKEHALTYRDGLLIALIASIPLRRRTLTAIRIGKQLVKTGDGWALYIPAEDTKTRQALEFPLFPELSARIDSYLVRYRSRIPGANRHDGLWASNQARSMDGGAIYDMVRSRTKGAFGFPVNLHRFRRAAGTFWAIEDPVNVRGVKDLLGHASFTTTDVHYIAKQSRLAGRKMAEIIQKLENGPRRRL
jgi:integrase